MKVYNFNNLPKGVGSTKTLAEFGSQLGTKPHLVKEVISLPSYQSLTAMKLTEQLGQIVGIKQPKNLKAIESFMFDWMIEAGDRIPVVRLSEDCNETFEGGVEAIMVFETQLYGKGDTFEFVRSGQQFIVKRTPVKRAEDKWEHWVQLVTSDLSNKANPNFLKRGAETKFIAGAYVPEASERGSSWQTPFALERHRNIINRLRVSGSRTGDYAALEPRYLQDAGGTFYKQSAYEVAMQDKLMQSINNSLMFAHGNFDKNFDILVREEDGRAIPIGEGIIPQLRRYCSQMSYNILTIKLLREIIEVVIERREKKVGNDLVMMCNRKLYVQVQELLDMIAGARLTVQEHFITKVDGGRLLIGAHYAGYQFAGNKIFLMEDHALTNRYTQKGYGIILNTKVMDRNGVEKLNVEQYTIKGAELMRFKVEGAGGSSGYASGSFASMIHATEDSMMAYRGVAVYDPYSAFILDEN